MPRSNAEQLAIDRGAWLSALQNMDLGTYSNFGDIFDWSQWDSFYLDSTEPTYRLFSKGVGDSGGLAGADKNEADTNQRGSQFMPKGAKMLIMYWKIFFNLFGTGDETVLQAIEEVFANFMMDVQIFGKATYGQWGLDELMNYPMAALVVPSVPGDSILNSSQLKGAGMIPLKIPIPIAAQTTFDVIITSPGGNSDIALDDSKVKIVGTGAMARLS